LTGSGGLFAGAPAVSRTHAFRASRHQPCSAFVTRPVGLHAAQRARGARRRFALPAGSFRAGLAAPERLLLKMRFSQKAIRRNIISNRGIRALSAKVGTGFASESAIKQ